MKNIIVYVEGPSDRAVMEQLLKADIERAMQGGCRIRFLPTEGKLRLVTQIPRRAADTEAVTLRFQVINDPHLVVFAVPDLYPPNIGGSHTNFPELEALLCRTFHSELRKRGRDDDRLRSRFRPHCFQYDLESLLLSQPDQLASYLGLGPLQPTWSVPVEEQNHQRPPKRIVEELFLKKGRRYRDTRDAPVVLAQANPDQIAGACHLRFAPFLADLRLAAEL